MSLFYKVSDKELVKLKNNVFTERGIPALIKNGFSQSPFSTSWFGKDDLGGYTYDFCRISDGSRLEWIFVDISKGDRWVQLDLNIFRLHPTVVSIEQLKDVGGLQFHLPPNSITEMRLEPPDGFIFVGLPQHKIRSFFTKAGLERRLRQLGDLLQNDLENIDSFVERWVEEHGPLDTDWEGHVIKQ